MKGVQLTKLAQELNLTNLTPDIDLTEIYVKTAEINRPALQLTGYLEHCKRACADHRLCRVYVSDAVK